MPRSQIASNAPNKAVGTDRMTMNGIDQLSYCAARIRKTKTMASAKTKIATEPAFSSWKVMPVHSKPKSFGSAVAAALCIASIA